MWFGKYRPPGNSGSASLATSSLARGTHSIKAVYGGDSNVNGATSAALSESITKK